MENSDFHGFGKSLDQENKFFAGPLRPLTFTHDQFSTFASESGESQKTLRIVWESRSERINTTLRGNWLRDGNSSPEGFFMDILTITTCIATALLIVVGAVFICWSVGGLR